MIKILFRNILITLCVYVLGLFLLLQYIYWNDIATINSASDIVLNFDWHILRLKEYADRMMILNGACIVLFLILTISNLITFTTKNKYHSENYNRLLTTWERKRGTVRVQFTKDGKVTRKTLECYYDMAFRWVTRKQNDVCSHYFLPKNRYWNTPKELKDANGHFKVDELSKPIFSASGIPVVAYRKYFLFGKFNRINYIDDVIHALFIGMTGKGKSQSFVLPMIQSNINAQESMFVHDPKRELLATTKQQLIDEGYKVVVIDFVNPELSEGWNPLAFAYDRWEKAIVAEKRNQCKKEIAIIDEKLNQKIINKEQHKQEVDTLLETTSVSYRDVNLSEAIELVNDISKTVSYTEDARDSFWTEGAGDMIASAVFLLMEEGKKDLINFSSVNYIYQLGEENDVLKKYLEKYRNLDDESVLKSGTFFSAESAARGSLKATFKNKVSILTSTPDIQQLLAKSTWSFDEIFEEKTAIFMVTHDEKSTYYPLVTIFFKQIYEAMIKWTRDNAKDYGGKLKTPWNMYIDEMGLLPEIKDIEAIFGAARSRGMRMYCFFQSFAQLVQKYETEGSKIIQDNSTHTVYLGSKHKEVTKEFSEMAGREVFYNGDTSKWEERNVLTSEHLQKFEKGRSLITAVEWNPYIAKLPPYFKYTFAQQPNFDFKPIKKEPLQWFNIKEALEEKRVKELEDKGVKKISGFNSMRKEKS